MKNVVEKISLIRTLLKEQKLIIRDIWQRSAKVLNTKTTNSEFYVKLDQLPSCFLKTKKNLFSLFFLSVLHVLNIKQERRFVYAQINHLFRIWVTSADNLLDNEDKETLKILMPGSSLIMRQVIAIMVADRVLFDILLQAKQANVFSHDEVLAISHNSLQVLLPAAAEEGWEEGWEEGGMDKLYSPQYILEKIHPVKTGILFYIPLMGPELIEKNIDKKQLAILKYGLMRCGVACQLLDDLSDVVSDFEEKRANYFISSIFFTDKKQYEKLKLFCKEESTSKKLHKNFPAVYDTCLKLATQYLDEGFSVLDSAGLNGLKSIRKILSNILIKKLTSERVTND